VAGWLRTPYLSLRRAGMAGWTAGGWLAEDPWHSCRLFHLVMRQFQLFHHLLQILLVHLTKDFVKLCSVVLL
jgi:hypothetical protein